MENQEQSWTKLLSIEPLLNISRPLVFWKNTEFVHESIPGQMVFYNTATQKINHVRIYGLPGTLNASIFSMNGASVSSPLSDKPFE
ncbi:hypothetical protein F0562_010637 [Nyssa sinensis]|uniref:F-box associated domain-containing protein n=1 Tax=Nyssa sinensis TaxID=561372 RepID=A0A5J5A1Q4_9ASTE|nr:hypothetical protein F0562_010637 [Nyssa sinensis]